jgi:hypothetical protein
MNTVAALKEFEMRAKVLVTLKTGDVTTMVLKRSDRHPLIL